MAKRSEIPEFGLLSGVRVVHCTTSIAGPLAASLFAEAGADVIMLENAKTPCMSRNRFGGPCQQNAKNERNLSLDIPSPEGKKVFLKLMEQTDIFIEASKGGQYNKWGISDEVLWEHNPRLVIVHISGFGQTGIPEYVRRGSYDTIAQAFGCYMQLNGFPDQTPIPAMPQPVDHLCGVFAYGSGLAALRKAEQTGKGESIDLAQYEIAMRCQNSFPVDYINHNDIPKREGNHSSMCCGYGLYLCKDGKSVYVMILGGGSLKRAFPLLGLEFGSDLYPADSSMIYPNTPAGDLFEQRLTEFCLKRTAQEVEEVFLTHDVPCSMVMEYEDALKNPHYKAREVFKEWEMVDGEKFTGVNIFPKLKNHPGQIWRGAPTVGMDNEDILAELGLKDEEIEELYSKKVIVKREFKPGMK